MAKELYPVLSLNTNITTFLQKIISADILGCVRSGLKNEVELTDMGTHISNVASIEKSADGLLSQVRLSSAYCQYFWLLCDVVLKILDRKVITAACTDHGISLKHFLQCVEETNRRTKDQVLPFIPDFYKPDIERYLAYLKIVPEILAVDFWEKVESEYACAVSLKDRNIPIDITMINNVVDMNSKYSERTNSVYSYGIAFCMLHELAHHQLKHFDKPEEMKDEIDADAKAFWNIYKDIQGEERFSANIGMLCVFFSFMMLNPTLEEDNIHPREDKRIFAIYDAILKENPKYTLLLVNILDFWAKMNQIEDYPKDMEPVSESVVRIKSYFKIS